jgi:hypothetical protein
MDDDNTTEWLNSGGRKGFLTVTHAKELASQSRLGWYIARHGPGRHVIGKLTFHKLSARHILRDSRGRPLTFSSIEDARTFLESELNIHAPQIFDF